MPRNLTYADLCRLLAGGANRVKENQDLLSRLDAATGDGDHGVTMKRTAEAMLESVGEPCDQGRRPAVGIAGLERDVGRWRVRPARCWARSSWAWRKPPAPGRMGRRRPVGPLDGRPGQASQANPGPGRRQDHARRPRAGGRGIPPGRPGRFDPPGCLRRRGPLSGRKGPRARRPYRLDSAGRETWVPAPLDTSTPAPLPSPCFLRASATAWGKSCRLCFSITAAERYASA